MLHYSKEGQDLFVTALIKEPGFYLDIGSAEPLKDNNTYLLETLGWNGLLIDQNEAAIAQCIGERKAKAFCLNVEDINWERFLEENNVPKIIDYISLDVDNANVDVIQKFPFSTYQCKIITFETDFYSLGDQRKKTCKEVLSQYPSYHYLAEDLITENLIFEDWIINKEFFDEQILTYTSSKLHWKEFLSKIIPQI